MDVVDANIGRLALFNTPLVSILQILLINFIQQNSFLKFDLFTMYNLH